MSRAWFFLIIFSSFEEKIFIHCSCENSSISSPHSWKEVDHSKKLSQKTLVFRFIGNFQKGGILHQRVLHFREDNIIWGTFPTGAEVSSMVQLVAEGQRETIEEEMRIQTLTCIPRRKSVFVLTYDRLNLRTHTSKFYSLSHIWI